MNSPDSPAPDSPAPDSPAPDSPAEKKTSAANPADSKVSDSAEPRRGFVKLAALLLGGLVTVIPILPGLAVFLDPLRRRAAGDDDAASADDAFVRITTLESVTADGVPRAFPVIADQHDAWTFYPQQRVGSVFLRREAGQSEVQCLSNICPHAGCSVQYSAETDTFKCPCHNSQFALDGSIIQPSPSPRGMDHLETRVADSGAVHIKYVRYYPAQEEQKEIT